MDQNLAKVIEYMKSHWPSQVKKEWQVGLNEYPQILKKVIADFTPAQTKNHQFIRIAGLSGSGKTTQILPAVEAYCKKTRLPPHFNCRPPFRGVSPTLSRNQRFLRRSKSSQNDRRI